MKDQKKVDRLRALAASIRRRDLQMVYGAKPGHIPLEMVAVKG